MGDTLKATEKRLAILTDVVKTANSILEPSKVIELVMEKIRQLIPSEAWSLLMVDEEKGELVFEAALGAKGSDVASYRLKLGEGVAGWVAETGKPAIVNDTARDRRFTPRLDSRTSFATRSILCVPLVSRGRTIGVVEIINKRDGAFSRADLEVMLTLVEPCAIALENAILFQRTEQLTITDDLTKLFNSRYLNLYLGREIKRCKRHGIPLSIIFLDLDGFKGINDQYGHLAGSGTLTEVGLILADGRPRVGHPGSLRWRRVRGGPARDPGRRGAGHRRAPATFDRGEPVPQGDGPGRPHLRIVWDRLLPRPRAHSRGPDPEGRSGHVPRQGAGEERYRGGSLVACAGSRCAPRTPRRPDHEAPTRAHIRICNRGATT